MLRSYIDSRLFRPMRSSKRPRNQFGSNLNLELLEDRKLMTGGVGRAQAEAIRIELRLARENHAEILRFDHVRNTGAPLTNSIGSATETQAKRLVSSRSVSPTQIAMGLSSTTASTTPAETLVNRGVQSVAISPTQIAMGVPSTTANSAPTQPQVNRLVSSYSISSTQYAMGLSL